MINKISDELNFNATALELRAKRQEVLSANLANAETPKYQARDMDFASTLRAATGTPDMQTLPPVQLATTNARHIAGDNSNETPTALMYRTPSQPSIDGNTVDPDMERANFTDNAIRYDAALKMLDGQIKSLQTAMQAPNS